ncbi:MAG: sugar transferase [Deltaproteobacteria bacterium]|nr:sugar transferase [Deltaproteobacteria bacterium]
MQTERTAVHFPLTPDECELALDHPAWEGNIRRCLDLLLAITLCAIALPLLLLIGLLIRIDSQGPVLYTRIRMGKNGRPFPMYKFRSMFVDADERLHEFLLGDPELQNEYEQFHKLREDPRITRVGKVLRRFSLDELPQLWNVIRGDMAIVGPRPYDPGERAKMQQAGRIILAVKPGLTGLWQISGRSHVSFYDRLKMDCRYVTERSVIEDLRILACTLKAVLSGRGAY